jgi:hypothetical protein
MNDLYFKKSASRKWITAVKNHIFSMNVYFIQMCERLITLRYHHRTHYYASNVIYLTNQTTWLDQCCTYLMNQIYYALFFIENAHLFFNKIHIYTENMIFTAVVHFPLVIIISIVKHWPIFKKKLSIMHDF